MAQMEITTVIGCRVQCLFCPQTLLMDKYEEQNNTQEITWGTPEIMSFETFKTCIDKIPTSTDIHFSGFAEPWLNPDCSKMLVYSHKKGHAISVYSTLVGMTIDDVEQWKDIPFKKFEIHLPDAQKYAKIALNKQYVELLEKLISSNIQNLACMTMGDIPDEIRDIIKVNFPPNRMIDRAGNSEFGEKTPKKFGPLYCRRAHNKTVNTLDSNVLLPNGDVSFCCMDYGLDNILGNLTKMNYDSLFNNSTSNEILQKMNSNDGEIMCRNCNESVFANPQKSILGNKFDETYQEQSTKAKFLLNNLYNELLFRDTDEEGLNYFIPLLVSNKISLEEVRITITKSNEYKHILNRQKLS